MLNSGVLVVFLLLLLTFFSYAYYFILALTVAAIMLIGLLFTLSKSQKDIVSTFEVNSQGQCIFEDAIRYQLHVSSRFSFLGCWLILQPIPALSTMFHAKSNSSKTLLFIYRDSLSEQDFSRLSNIISQLNH